MCVSSGRCGVMCLTLFSPSKVAHAGRMLPECLFACLLYLTFCKYYIRLRKSVTDPHWFPCGSGSSSLGNAIRIQGFEDQFFLKFYGWKKSNMFDPKLQYIYPADSKGTELPSLQHWYSGPPQLVLMCNGTSVGLGYLAKIGQKRQWKYLPPGYEPVTARYGQRTCSRNDNNG